VLRPNEDVRECFRPTVGERYSIGAAGSNPYAFKVVESAAADGMMLRTTAFGPSETHVVSFPANTIVTIANNSPYPRNQNLKVDFTLIRHLGRLFMQCPDPQPVFPRRLAESYAMHLDRPELVACPVHQLRRPAGRCE
jgi:hypothetical protein